MKDSKLYLRQEHIDKLLAHVQRELPVEACGLLAGKNGRVRDVIPVTNALRSPVRYRMDPQEQIHAFLKIESEGLEITGIYHSHPDGPSTLSATDLKEAAYPDSVYLLLFRERGAWRWKGFTIHKGDAREVPVLVGSGGT